MGLIIEIFLVLEYNISIMKNERQLWNEVLDVLSKELSVVAMEVWIQPLEPVCIKDNMLILSAPLKNTKVSVKRNYSEQIKRAIMDVNTFVNDFDIILDDEVQAYAHESTPIPEEEVKVKTEMVEQFDKTFTFDNFVIGSSNQIAYAAAMAVAENPGKLHNPLFIYGGVGLGKTHIMHAIGNYIIERDPSQKILYVTTAQFTNDFIDSIRNNNETDSRMFREKYRDADVLMLDDIQFIAGKEATQEALFHIFNDLYHMKKQIILSSDRHPKELTFLNERLRSRFSYGLTCDITAPDIETRIAILEKKAFAKKSQVSDEVIAFIAEKIDSNIRELEGALNKVIFYAGLVGREANTIELAKEALKDDIDMSTHTLTIDSIADKVCEYYNVEKKDLVGKKRTSAITEPRFMCIYLINDLLSLPLAAIGAFFGGRNHATIIHARDHVAEALESDVKTRNDLKNLKDMIMCK